MKHFKLPWYMMFKYEKLDVILLLIFSILFFLCGVAGFIYFILRRFM